MSERAPTPWYANCNDLIGGWAVGTVRGHVSRSRLADDVADMISDKDIADRIVAAVNACEGISTEALEEGAVKDLLEACKAALYGVVDRGGPDGLSQAEVVDYLTAAIAKAGKE